VNRLPPRIVRRVVVAPVVLAICLVLIGLCPALLAFAGVIDLFLPGNSWRTLRLVAFCAAYLIFETVGIVWMFVLWVASGFGLAMRSERMQSLHYGFMKWQLKQVNGAARAFFRLRIFIEDRPKPTPGPVLVFSRHAGPGNSLMLVGTLMIGYQRRPRIVMLAKLQWDPLYDMLGNRLPNRFIQHDLKTRDVYVEAIADLARGMGDRDALVLFPEGRDFTWRHRLRTIAHLRRRGFRGEADKAERMRNVLPPRHRGTMAAIGAAAGADVVFVAHTVLEDIGSFPDLWSRIPFPGPIRSRYWRLPASEVPSGEQEQIDWLYAWWARIDQWIDERRTDEMADVAATPWTEGPTITS
jgi:hypothetical protein